MRVLSGVLIYSSVDKQRLTVTVYSSPLQLNW